eukprot:TRINITY_DN15352_c0_g1_i1.p1 TRINITY_DN15352_c0_g1~~TRINITY_DN15352_c0_g1_i1.p1  ORF type:complete len:272 (+),score=70.30 TRINITY_DN15352_c0_g1_i1:47-817(+)
MPACASPPGAWTWSRVNDTVMGGRSESALARREDGTLLWEGTVSLANGGGFASVRSDAAAGCAAGCDGVVVVLEAGGREVEVSAQRRDFPVRAGAYYASVPTSAHADTAVFVPWTAFQLRSFGRPVAGPALGDAVGEIDSFGLLIAKKQAGPFAVKIKAFSPAQQPEDARVASSVQPALEEAIRRGVPQFNAGDAAGCAAVYRDALAGLLAGGAFGKRALAAQVARVGIEAAGGASAPADSAWALRRAIDRVLAGA